MFFFNFSRRRKSLEFFGVHDVEFCFIEWAFSFGTSPFNSMCFLVDAGIEPVPNINRLAT